MFFGYHAKTCSSEASGVGERKDRKELPNHSYTLCAFAGKYFGQVNFYGEDTMRQSEKIRFLVYTTVFGALWGLAEMLIGSYLHMIQFPFSGALMAAAGAVILSAERIYTPRAWATLSTGGVALIMKLLAIGGFKLGPAAGILIESAMLEILFSLAGCGAAPIFAAGVLSSLESIPHFFVTNWIIYGRGIFSVYMEAVKQMQNFFGFPPNLWKIILALWLAGHLAAGIGAGILSVIVTNKIRGR